MEYSTNKRLSSPERRIHRGPAHLRWSSRHFPHLFLFVSFHPSCPPSPFPYLYQSSHYTLHSSSNVSLHPQAPHTMCHRLYTYCLHCSHSRGPIIHTPCPSSFKLRYGCAETMIPPEVRNVAECDRVECIASRTVLAAQRAVSGGVKKMDDAETF